MKDLKVFLEGLTMTKHEVEELIKTDFKFYRTDISQYQDDEITLMTNVWYYHFKDYPTQLVKQAFLGAMARTTRLVQLADIVRQIEDMYSKSVKLPQAEWDDFANRFYAIARYASYKTTPKVVGIDEKTKKPLFDNGEKSLEAEFNAKPDRIKEFCGSVDGMVKIAHLDDKNLSHRRNEFIEFCNKRKPDLTEFAKNWNATQQNAIPEQTYEFLGDDKLSISDRLDGKTATVKMAIAVR
jgi:hypothetical protein